MDAFGGAARVGDRVELEDHPATIADFGERAERARQVDPAAPQLDELIRGRVGLGVRGARHGADVLGVQDGEAGLVRANGGRDVAAGLRVVRHVEQEADGSGVARREDLGHFLGPFAEVAHVVVVDQLHAEGRRALAQLRQDAAHPLAILGRRRAVLGPLVGDLEELTAGGPDEPGVLLVQGHRLGLALGRQEDVVAREADELDLVLGQQRLQRLRLLAELRHRRWPGAGRRGSPPWRCRRCPSHSRPPTSSCGRRSGGHRPPRRASGANAEGTAGHAAAPTVHAPSVVRKLRRVLIMICYDASWTVAVS